ncbi:MAG: hypothetical protein HY721_06130 [Planctomycetes bacterium]|nr:hypothetical protein [Planctomycetota bacterium]
MFLPLVPGQEAAKASFRRVLERGRLSHAYLLAGPDAGTTRLFARELSKAFHCARGTACGACVSCAAVEHGNHPSVHAYGPAEGKAVIEIDTIRALCERTHYRSEELVVAVLERADLMTEPAANALLKTLEEPPGSAALLLTAQSTGSLLPTIVSRCHRVYLPRAAASQAAVPPPVGELLEDLASPGFFAREDPRSRLLRTFPDEEGSRNVLRRLLDILLEDWRASLPGLGGSALDGALRRIGAFLELRQDVERNVNPDLVLERLIRTVRHGV